MCSMLNGAGLKDELWSKIWAEYAMTTTYFSNVIATKSGNNSPHKLPFGCKSKFNLTLKIFGEIGVVTSMDTIQGKLRIRESNCIFVGYSDNHSREVFRMSNLKSCRVINSRYVVWLNKMHKQWIIENQQFTKPLKMTMMICR
jgi:hypothetical protein